MIVAVSTLHAAVESQEALEAAFRGRKKLVDSFPGFRRLQLVKGRGTNEYMLLLEWDSMDAFRAYVRSPAFEHAHPPTADDSVAPGGLRIYDLLLDSAKGD
ncbi:MAG TPA: antibiotic biosynthesis monooxygenase [Candidatus Thermoplasmatota archaeon]|nr:antibiotic biosynthesis monooxygenase [Candidatus Thermoplasmatota archaeon]